MSHAINFDTHTFIKTLEDAGIESKQAEAIKNAIEYIFDENFTENAKKDDIKLLKAEVTGEIHKLKSDILMWVIGLMFVQTGIILTVIKLFH